MVEILKNFFTGLAWISICLLAAFILFIGGIYTIIGVALFIIYLLGLAIRDLN
jgi:hypothetical protein